MHSRKLFLRLTRQCWLLQSHVHYSRLGPALPELVKNTGITAGYFNLQASNHDRTNKRVAYQYLSQLLLITKFVCSIGRWPNYSIHSPSRTTTGFAPAITQINTGSY